MPHRLLATICVALASQLPAQDLKVMPLGDSITEASNGRASYRYWLWHSLRNSGHCPDFVGSLKGVWNGKPKFADFDQDHEGHWGWRTDQVLAKMPTWAKLKPDLVLCHLGSNDLMQKQTVASTVTELGKIIDELRKANANVTVLLAQIIPLPSWTKIDVSTFNKALPALVKSKSTMTSPVILVDQFTGFVTSKHSYDGIHPNETGEKLMAANWQKAIAALKVTCKATFATFGKGCAGSGGVPTLAAVSGARPLIGKTFTVTMGSLPTDKNSLTFGIAGGSNTSFGGVSLPLDLSKFGAPGCSLLVGMDIVTPLTRSGTTATWSATIPNIPAFAGVSFYLQGYATDSKRNALGVVVTNGAVGRLGMR